MKKTLLISLLAATAWLTPSCNTIIGIGRDLRLMGEGVEKTATKASGEHPESQPSGAPVY